jgi:hypothetical protein
MVCPSPWMRLMSDTNEQDLIREQFLVYKEKLPESITATGGYLPEHTRGPTMRHYHIQDHPPRDQSSDRGELQSVARDIVEGI